MIECFSTQGLDKLKKGLSDSEQNDFQSFCECENVAHFCCFESRVSAMRPLLSSVCHGKEGENAPAKACMMQSRFSALMLDSVPLHLKARMGFLLLWREVSEGALEVGKYWHNYEALL